VLREWMEHYLAAWSSNDPEEIGALFTDDALYYTEPFAAPWRGRTEIVEQWLARKDEPGQVTFEWQPLVETREVAVITGMTTYKEPAIVYSNLWVMHLDADGRCRELTEWWMKHPAAESSSG
jgi:uncharacterized protein (TIGR02246 family)